jgi:hypothetical protein
MARDLAVHAKILLQDVDRDLSKTVADDLAAAISYVISRGNLYDIEYIVLVIEEGLDDGRAHDIEQTEYNCSDDIANDIFSFVTYGQADDVALDLDVSKNGIEDIPTRMTPKDDDIDIEH